MVSNSLFLAPFVGRDAPITVKQYHDLSETTSLGASRQRLTGLVKKGWAHRTSSGAQGTVAYFDITPAGQAAWDADDAAEQAAWDADDAAEQAAGSAS